MIKLAYLDKKACGKLLRSHVLNHVQQSIATSGRRPATVSRVPIVHVGTH
jgi:hypothetical protein